MFNADKTTVLFIVFIHSCQYVSSSGSPPSWFNPSSADSRTISENTAASTSVYNAIATDPEGDDLVYSIHVQNPASPAFQLNSTTGELRSPSTLDAEATTFFTFEFNVTDSTSTVTSSILTINIDDENEFSPVFNQSSYTGTIYDTISNGEKVLTVFASDDDTTSSLSYTVTVGDTTTFSLGTTSGALTVAAVGNLNPSLTPSYTLTVQASDGTSTDTTTVIITVLDDPCFPNPCQNSGTCTSSGTSYTCACQSGWIGTTCTTDDPCLPDPCENSGTCTISGTMYQCSCTQDFSGPNCTETPNQNAGSSDDRLSTGAIVGICTGITIAIAFTSVIVFLYVKISLSKIKNDNGVTKSDTFKRRRTSSFKRNIVTPIDKEAIVLQSGELNSEHMKNGRLNTYMHMEVG